VNISLILRGLVANRFARVINNVTPSRPSQWTRDQSACFSPGTDFQGQSRSQLVAVLDLDAIACSAGIK
jgi:hypothetical protein